MAIAWLEKQGEKEYDDKVEPKFKIEKGKWYVCTQTFTSKGKIIVIKGQTYQSNQDGIIEGEDEWIFVDKLDGKAVNYFKPWTIQDARCGDVLVHNGCTFIFMGVKNGIVQALEKNLLEGTNPVCFGDPDRDGDYHPATKEQRDALFAKMKEAGYEWDAEKKELKKTDEEVNGEDYGIDGLWHAQRILEKTLGSVEGYQSDDGILDHKAAITAVKKLYEKKPVDKVDQHSLPVSDDSSLPAFDESIYHPCTEEVYKQKPVWSEEDEYHKRQILRILKDNGCSQTLQERTEKWIEERLKSIRPQSQWRPSDDQIDALHYVTNFDYGGHKATLVSLYEQLKKLREE